MTVFRPLIVEPVAIEGQKIVESTFLAIERVAEEGCVCSSEGTHALRIFPQLFQQHRQDESARIVIGAVAFGKIGDAEHGVLEYAG